MSRNEYRLFFLDEHAAIQARQEFLAADDGEAIIFAALLFDACSEDCSGYELWNGARIVVSTFTGLGTSDGTLTHEDITEKQQRYLLELEEILRHSHWRISKSKKLLEATEILRERVAKEPL